MRSASPSSNTVEDRATSTAPSANGSASAAEIDAVEQPLAPGQRPRLARQIGAHVAADQAIGAGGTPRQLNA
jgi:hypothetical protein